MKGAAASTWQCLPPAHSRATSALRFADRQPERCNCPGPIKRCLQRYAARLIHCRQAVREHE